MSTEKQTQGSCACMWLYSVVSPPLKQPESKRIRRIIRFSGMAITESRERRRGPVDSRPCSVVSAARKHSPRTACRCSDRDGSSHARRASGAACGDVWVSCVCVTPVHKLLAPAHPPCCIHTCSVHLLMLSAQSMSGVRDSLCRRVVCAVTSARTA